MNKKALALIAAGLIILIAIVYFIFIYDFGASKNQVTNTTPTQQTGSAEPVITKSSPTTKPTETRSAVDQSRDNATQLAISFAERYGTSSSQADFSNLIDAEVFMTTAFKDKTNKFIGIERNKTATNSYQSIVTKAMIVDFSTFNETAGTAEGLVKTKRQNTDVDGKVTTVDQALAISLKKVGTDWKVEKADWK